MVPGGPAGRYWRCWCQRLSATTQPLEHGPRGEAVGYRADRRLELPQGIAGPAAEPPIGLADVEAPLRQELLQFVALCAGEHAFVPRPRLHNWLAAAQPVGE